ncbi:MAG: ABC transporter substrate-binding protein/permease [Bdellovibrionota bacterium]
MDKGIEIMDLLGGHRRIFQRLLFLGCIGFSFLGRADDVASLKVGLTGKYPPFNYFDTQGQLTGFDVEVAEELCRRLSMKCEFKVLQWDGILSALLSDRIDVIIASMAITPEREKAVNFTEPYYISGAQLFLKENKLKTESKKLKIGVTLGTTYGVFAKKKYPEAEIRTYKGDVEALQDVENGQIDGLITDKLVGLHMMKTFNAPLKASGDLLYEEHIGIPIKKERTQLLADINRELKSFQASQDYQVLWAKYFEDRAEQLADQELYWFQAIRLLLKALLNTIALSFSGVLMGAVLATLFATLMISGGKALRRGVAFYVDFIRSTPFLVQLFAIYFGLPALGVHLSPWSAGILAIALHSSAYVSEIIKTAYMAVPVGQKLAAKALGLNSKKTLTKVVLPQMLPMMSAPVLNTVVAMIKDSAIVSVISVHELTLQAQELISATFRPLEFYALAALLYFLITYPFLVMGRRLEKNFKRKGLLHGE